MEMCSAGTDSVSEKGSPEIQLLLLCSRKEMDQERLSRLEALLAKPIDWPLVVRQAFFHRVAPLVFRNLKLHAWESVPEAQAGQLTDGFMKNQGHMMFLTSELIRLVRALKTENIKAIALKGPALAASVYDNVAMRFSGDLDILVRRNDLPLALDVMRRCGYRVRLGNSEDKVSANQEAAIRRFHYHYILYHQDNGYTVELHFRLFGGKLRWGATTEEAFAESQTLVIAGQEILVLNDYENLSYLCLHGGKHAWSRLEWIVTMAEFLTRFDESDEVGLWERAEARGAGLAVLLGLTLARRLFGINPFPSLCARGERSPIVNRLSARLVRLVHEEVKDHSGERIAQEFQWELCGSLHRRLHLYLSRKLIPNVADVAEADRSPLWHFLYYLGPIKRLLNLGGGKADAGDNA